MADDETMSRSKRTSELRKLAASNVRRFRLQHGWSQEKLAKHARIDRTHLARFESRAINVSLDVVLCLAAALKIDVRDLFVPPQEWDED